jgi:hypothetical protein
MEQNINQFTVGEQNCSQCGVNLNQRPQVFVCHDSQPCKYGHQQSTATSTITEQSKEVNRTAVELFKEEAQRRYPITINNGDMYTAANKAFVFGCQYASQQCEALKEENERLKELADSWRDDFKVRNEELKKSVEENKLHLDRIAVLEEALRELIDNNVDTHWTHLEKARKALTSGKESK